MRYLAEHFKRRNKNGLPWFKEPPSHDLYAGMINSEYGFGGMMTLDVGSLAKPMP
jgi:methionine-gamma-lyase